MDRTALDAAETILDLFNFHLQNRPNHPLFTYVEQFGARETTLTFAELDAQARAIGAHLQTLAPPNSRAIMLYPPGIAPVPAFFGIQYAGMVAVPVIPPRPGQPPTLLTRLIADAQTNLILTTAGMLHYLKQQFGASEFFTRFNWIATDELAAQPPPDDFQPVPRKPEDVVFLLYTSGSTNFPKGVMSTNANILFHVRSANSIFKPDPDDKIVSWMPLYHGGGLMGGVINPTYSSTYSLILSPLEVLERPGYWLKTLSDSGTEYAVATNFLYQMAADRITPAELAQLDLSRLKKVFTGAEPIRAATLEHFARTFAPAGFDGKGYITGYALSESTHVATFNLGGIPRILTLARDPLARGEVRVQTDDSEGRTFVSCGQPVPGLTLLIVDPNTNTICPPDRIGEIWIQGPNVAVGYWNNPQATEDTFNARLSGDPARGAFLRTGDLGFIYDGDLYIAGRIKDMLIVRGKNYYAQDIEAAVMGAHPSLQAGAGAAFGIEVGATEEIVLMHEINPNVNNVNVDEIAAAIRAAAAERLDLPLYAVAIVAAGSLPRTSLGKIQRYLCRQEYLNAQKGI